MSLDPKLIQAISDYNEVIAEKRFKKLGLAVERLDRQGPRSRPEFLVSDTAGPLLVAEVKTICSGGYLRERHAHASTLDPSFIGTGATNVKIDFRHEVLEEAISKYRCLVEDYPEYGSLPFTVVLFHDEIADHFNLQPGRMEQFPEISGLLRVERDYERERVIGNMSLDELRQRIASGSMKDLPPATKEFRILENECATHPLPGHFIAMCIAT